MIALLHRLGFDYRKPRKAPRNLDEARRKAFIAGYEKLLNTMGIDEAVVLVDAVHPTHQVHAAGRWAPKGIAIAVEQTTGRQSLNIHGSINLETGQTQMLEVAKVNARSLIALLKAVEVAHPQKRRIHVHLDNASHHHARRVAAFANVRCYSDCVAKVGLKRSSNRDSIPLNRSSSGGSHGGSAEERTRRSGDSERR